MENGCAYYVGDMIQIHEPSSDGGLRMRAVFPEDPDWLDAVGLAAAFGSVANPGLPAPMATLSSAIASINAVRGEVRARFITILPGQDLVYGEKKAEAEAWVAARSAGLSLDPIDFPHIAAEVGITGTNADEVAQVILNMSHILALVSSVIEGKALSAIGEVEAATTVEAAHAAAAAFPAALAAAMSAAGYPL